MTKTERMEGNKLTLRLEKGEGMANIFKWVVGDDYNPREELVTLIPRAFADDDDWWFVRAGHIAMPQYRVFETPQEAALAAVKLCNREIERLKSLSNQILAWHQELEAKRETEGATT
jgi:hypothetical protein